MKRYTVEEQKQHRKELVAALRSGKYRQGMNQLKKDDKFCCLGVACDISGLGDWEGDTYYTEGDASKIVMPVEVKNYYGFHSRRGTMRTIYIENKEYPSLLHINDEGHNFSVIADIIESEPEGLLT